MPDKCLIPRRGPRTNGKSRAAISAYHREESCSRLHKDCILKEITIEIARLRGLHPCPFCHILPCKRCGSMHRPMRCPDFVMPMTTMQAPQGVPVV